jgi:Zn-dependent protease/CBS domain-containing protein
LSLKVGEISGITIKLNYSWFIIFVLMAWSLASGYLPYSYPDQSETFYWGVGVVGAAALFLSVLIHEVSHSLVAKRYKIRVESITLYFLGGVSETEEEAQSAEEELRMAAAGPLTSLGLGVVFYLLWLGSTFALPLAVVAVLEYASYINFLLAAFNMIPAFPMDGGRVLRAIIWGRRKDILSSTRLATMISKAISYGFIALGLLDMFFYSGFDGLWLIIIGFFVSSSADASMNETRISQALAGVKVGDIMSKDVHTVEPGISIQEIVNRHFSTFKHHGFPVVSDGELVGIITLEDVRRIPLESWDERRVEDVMKPFSSLVTSKPGEEALDALIKMAKRNVGRLPVLDEGKLVGIITRSDITRAVQLRLRFRS